MHTTLRNSVLIAAGAALAFAGSGALALAHELQTDGTIGVEMHVDPNDEPVAGSPATFFFEITDTTSKFDPRQCDCRVSITRAGSDIFAQSLFASSSKASLTDASLSYVFEQAGDYQVALSGKPLTPGAFQPFTVRYEVRVGVPDTGAIAGFFRIHLFHTFLTIGAALFVIIGILYDRLVTRRKSP